MPSRCLILVAVLAVLTAADALAQTSGVGQAGNLPSQTDNLSYGGDIRFSTANSFQRLPPVDESSQAVPCQYLAPVAGEPPLGAQPGSEALLVPPPGNADLASGEPKIDGESIDLKTLTEEPPEPSLYDFWGYRYHTDWLGWIPGGGDQFGMFTLGWNHYVKSGIEQGLGLGAGFYFLSGPNQTDMPAIVYDFSASYQIRQRLGELAFDLSVSVLAASDFKGCAREGIRYPAHAVGYLTLVKGFDVVFGIDYLDRGDYKLLPVMGAVWVPNDTLRFELVFPRPRIYYQFMDRHRLYVGGDLGGGTWAIEREWLADDLATYRDLRVCLGLESVEKSGHRCAFEVAYLFDRRLMYASNIGNMNLNDALMISLVTRY
jgi:hypothetical protein